MVNGQPRQADDHALACEQDQQRDDRITIRPANPPMIA